MVFLLLHPWTSSSEVHSSARHHYTDLCPEASCSVGLQSPFRGAQLGSLELFVCHQDMMHDDDTKRPINKLQKTGHSCLRNVRNADCQPCGVIGQLQGTKAFTTQQKIIYLSAQRLFRKAGVKGPPGSGVMYMTKSGRGQ